MKKHNKKKQSGNYVRKHIIWIIIIILVILQALSFLYITKIQNSVNRDHKSNLYATINNLEEKRYKYPPIDVAANKVYIPEAHIYLPLNDTTRDLRYNVIAIKGLEAIYFSLNGSVGRQTESDDPTCDKMVALTQTKDMGSDSDFTFAGAISPTKDGLQYIYKHSSCQLYTDTASQNLVEAVKSIQQY